MRGKPRTADWTILKDLLCSMFVRREDVNENGKDTMLVGDSGLGEVGIGGRRRGHEEDRESRYGEGKGA